MYYSEVSFSFLVVVKYLRNEYYLNAFTIGKNDQPNLSDLTFVQFYFFKLNFVTSRKQSKKFSEV